MGSALGQSLPAPGRRQWSRGQIGVCWHCGTQGTSGAPVTGGILTQALGSPSLLWAHRRSSLAQPGVPDLWENCPCLILASVPPALVSVLPAGLQPLSSALPLEFSVLLSLSLLPPWPTFSPLPNSFSLCFPRHPRLPPRGLQPLLVPRTPASLCGHRPGCCVVRGCAYGTSCVYLEPAGATPVFCVSSAAEHRPCIQGALGARVQFWRETPGVLGLGLVALGCSAGSPGVALVPSGPSQTAGSRDGPAAS